MVSVVDAAKRELVKLLRSLGVAKAKFRNFKKVCQTVWKKKGAASGS